MSVAGDRIASTRPHGLLNVLAFLLLATATAIADPPSATETNGNYVASYFVVQLADPLAAGDLSGELAIPTGRADLDRAIREHGIESIRFALEVSMRQPRDRHGLARHGLDRTYRFLVPPGADIPALVRAFEDLPGVVYAEPDYIGTVGATVPNDTRFDEQWNLDQASDADVDAPEAWDHTTGGDVVLAILDSGVDSDHPDFAGKTILPGTDIVNSDSDPEDDNGHGTRVTSIATAATNNSEGVAGVCWGCSIMPVKITDAGSGYNNADVADGIVWAVDNGADVINLSLQGQEGKSLLDALAYAADAGVVIVSITGNLGTSNVTYPGRYVETIALGMTDSTDRRASLSDYGRTIDVVAPGENVLTATMDGGYSSAGSGTSFAAPHVTGLAGLLLTVHPTLGREEVRHLVQAGAEDQVGDASEDAAGFDWYHGWGRINLERSLLGAESALSLRVEGTSNTRVYLATPNPLADSYDFVRGDVAALSEGPEGVDLGSVVCLEDDSADADTAGGNEDAASPVPGEVFFYVARFNAAPGAGSYGGSSTRRDRVPLDPHHQPRWTVLGGSTNARLGVEVGSADVNGDGTDDVLAGMSLYTGAISQEGAVRLYLGSASGPVSPASWQVEGGQASSRFGVYVDGAGDVNGDGFEDVLVGAPFYDNGEQDEGRAFVYHGSASGPSVSPDWTDESDQAGARFGARIRAAGDVNNDGFDDVLVGAQYMDSSGGSPGTRTDQGASYLYFGSSSGLSTTPDWEFFSGQADARGGRGLGSGDINGDGFHDVLVGAPFFDNGQTDEGRVFVFYGSASGPATTADDVLEIDTDFMRFGWSIDTADVNNDGFDDVIVGAPSSDSQTRNDEGMAYVFLGSASGVSTTASWTAPLTGQPEGDFGHVVAGLGDLDGDGFDEIGIGALLFDAAHRSDRGGVWIFRGSASGPESTAAWTEHPRASGGKYGADVVSGDFDGDGELELIVGSHWYTGANVLEGRLMEHDAPLANVPSSPVDCPR